MEKQYPTAAELAAALGGKKHGRYWKAPCPAHNDRHPSLDISIGDNGRPIFTCRAGCDNDTAVIPALVRLGHWPEPLDETTERRTHRGNGAAKPEPEPEDPRAWPIIMPVPDDVSDPLQSHLNAGEFREDRHAYRDVDGHVLFYIDRIIDGGGRKRFLPHTLRRAPSGSNRWTTTAPAAPIPLYGLDRLGNAPPDLKVLLVEGEKVADAADLPHGYAALSWCGGANKADRADYAPLKGFDVVAWPDNDEPGRKAMAAAMAGAIKAGAKSARIVQVPDSFPKGFDLADQWPEEGADPLERVTEFIRNATAGQGPHRRFPLVAFDAITLSTTDAYLVRDFIPSEGLVVIWGPPKCGKSFWTFDLVMHIATGRPYRGRDTKAGTVVYIACEGSRGLSARVAAYRQHHDIHDAQFYLLTTQLGLIHEAGELIDDIEAQMDGRKVDAIVIDTLNRSLDGSEIDDMSSYVSAADRVREAFHCAVIIIHHCGVEANRPRGHTSLTGAADAQIAITRDTSGSVVASVEFIKDGEEGATTTSHLEVITVGIDDGGHPITSCVITEADPAPAIDKQRRLRGKAAIAFEILKNCIATEGVNTPTGDGFPTTPQASIRLEQWRHACDRKNLADSDKSDTPRRTFDRARDALRTGGHIGICQNLVWIVGQVGQVRTDA